MLLTAGLVLGSLLTSLGWFLASSRPAERFVDAVVLRVIDGDTVELTSGDRVRYLGIDAPELFGDPECGAAIAASVNTRLVEGKPVQLLAGPEDRDRFGRLLRYVFSEGVFINAELAREGLVRAQSFDAEERFHQVIVQLQQSARETKRGLWEVCAWE